MSVLDTDVESARRYADAFGIKSDFARKVEQACDCLAAMEAQKQALDELIARSLKAVQESRALLLGMDAS